MAAEQDKNYWLERWHSQRTPFHSTEVNRHLKRWHKQLIDKYVFVPLCGKSIDMNWLASQGYNVVGVELSKVACDAFFSEQNIVCEKTTRSPFTCYESEHITLWCGDFFVLTKDHIRGCKSIYDRAAFIALDEKQRLAYVKHLEKIFHYNGDSRVDLLLITLEFDQSFPGPPFSIDRRAIHEIWQRTSNIHELTRIEDELTVRLTSEEATTVQTIQQVYHITW